MYEDMFEVEYDDMHEKKWLPYATLHSGYLRLSSIPGSKNKYSVQCNRLLIQRVVVTKVLKKIFYLHSSNKTPNMKHS